MLISIDGTEIEIPDLDEEKPLPSLIRIPVIMQQRRVLWIVLSRVEGTIYVINYEPIDKAGGADH